MGYCIKIGNAVHGDMDLDGGEYISFGPTVADASSEFAPVFDGDALTGDGNARHPSYSGWNDFTVETGLDDLFYDKDVGLIRKHPAVFALTKEHLTVVLNAIKEWKAKYPETKAGFNTGQDFQLARMLWLAFWMEWALKNCDRPAISNS